MTTHNPTDNDRTTPDREKGSSKWKLSLAICILILAAGAGIVALIFTTEPTAVRTEGTRESAMLVDVVLGERGSFHPVIAAMGTVIPVRDVVLRPQVNGLIVERSSAFTPGQFVTRGDTLLRIDPSDFVHQLEQRKSDLQQALADLDLEMGRQDIARQDYRAVGETLDTNKESLVLRKPQLSAAQARVAAARASVEQAELDLKRTTITAPFDAHVLRRDVDLGSQVHSGDALGRLVGTDTYWVEATLPLSRLDWLTFPDQEHKSGSPVRIRNRSAWPEGAFRTGRLFSFIGSLENTTRMVRVLISVDDPLGRTTSMQDAPPLMLGSFVQAEIQGRLIEDVVRIDRNVVRSGDTVWVMQDNALDIREVEVVFRDDRYAYIRNGLGENDPVVSTNLTTVVQGAGLRLDAANGTAPEAAQR